MSYAPRKCTHCKESWLEAGLPCPNEHGTRIADGVWECHNCHGLVSAENAVAP